MTRWWIAVALLGACSGTTGPMMTTPDAAAVDIDAAVTPPFSGECAQQFMLHGLDPQTPTITVDNLPIDTTGTAFCFVLDATSNLQYADFFVSTSQNEGETSPYELALFDAQKTLLTPGWDVTFGSNPSTTSAHLEYGVTVGTVLDAIVRVRMRSGTGTTSVSFTLLEPYE